MERGGSVLSDSGNNVYFLLNLPWKRYCVFSITETQRESDRSDNCSAGLLNCWCLQIQWPLQNRCPVRMCRQCVQIPCGYFMFLCEELIWNSFLHYGSGSQIQVCILLVYLTGILDQEVLICVNRVRNLQRFVRKLLSTNKHSVGMLSSFNVNTTNDESIPVTGLGGL
jgi:hypothetical protein